MRKKTNACFGALALAGLLPCASGVAMAQASQSGQGSQSQPRRSKLINRRLRK